MPKHSEFQSTPYAWVTSIPVACFPQTNPISIHTLRVSDFNVRMMCKDCFINFNPHPTREWLLRHVIRMVACPKFQSTPYAWVTSTFKQYLDVFDYISIHTLRVSDFSGQIVQGDAVVEFQSTPYAWVTSWIRPYSVQHLLYFNPHPTREWLREQVSRPISSVLFQSTPYAWVTSFSDRIWMYQDMLFQSTPYAWVTSVLAQNVRTYVEFQSTPYAWVTSANLHKFSF